uniref:Uncharacterized protein n=1 Tax=Streptomyces albus subsp. albus TaxID=67257 RepID=H1ZZM9_9ACTN|nr:hypothetical protein [Streptomyces albus subsp. albus]
MLRPTIRNASELGKIGRYGV